MLGYSFQGFFNVGRERIEQHEQGAKRYRGGSKDEWKESQGLNCKVNCEMRIYEERLSLCGCGDRETV